MLLSLSIILALLAKMSQANMMIDLLPIGLDCKQIFKQVIPAAEKEFKWIKDTICDKAKCTPPFEPCFVKYNPFVKQTLVLGWIFGTFSKYNHDITKQNIDVRKIYDTIVNKCIMGEPKIKNTKDICSARQEDFEGVKQCVIPEVIGYVPRLGRWADKACSIAKKDNLIQKIVEPQFKPNWRTMVTDFTKTPLCKGQ